MFITPVGLIIPKETLLKLVGDDGINSILRKLTHTRMDKRTKRPVKTKLYKPMIVFNKECYRFPKCCQDTELMTELGLGKVGLDKLLISNPELVKVSSSNAMPINAKYNGGVHANQTLLLNHLMENVYTTERRTKLLSGCILHLKPGMGKTHVALRLMCQLGMKTLIVVPNSILLNQWKEELNNYITGVSVGMYSGKKKKVADVTIAIVNSVRKWVTTADEFKDAGLVIYDEVHEYCSDVSRNIFWAAQRQCVLGLTGTPDERLDKLDIVYKLHLGRVISATAIPGFTYDDVVFTGSVNILQFHGTDEFTKELRNANGDANCSGTLSMITQDPIRNTLIVNNIVRILNKGTHVFVFSEFRSHLMTIHTLLKEAYGDVPVAFTNDVLMGGASTDEITEAYNDKNASVIFTTYMFSAVGISIERMNALVLATPRRSKMRQIIGRIMRRGSDYDKNREIVDIVDKRTFLAGQLSERRKVYRELGFNLTTSNVHAEAISGGDDDGDGGDGGSGSGGDPDEYKKY
jgi:superfamily II DNA or RNA helicase